MIILGIETSCDETAIAVVEASGDLERPGFSLLGCALHSQIKMHEKYGGVVPNLAKREHIRNLPIVWEQALEKAEVKMEDIDTIAVTVGPGLEPALWTGINFAEDLSKKYNKPLIPTNHMEGHIASVLLGGEKIQFPVLALLISGGHTELVLLQNWKEKKIIGETLDDAAGEAFDKVARMLGLPYPGGPQISALAEKARNSKSEILNFKLPRPMIHSGDYNFSFSGLKTAVLYYLRDSTSPHPPLLAKERGRKNNDTNVSAPLPFTRGGGLGGEVSYEIKLAVAREFEDAVSEVLVEKTKKAIIEFQPKTLIIGGGVIANHKIRSDFQEMIQNFPDIKLLIPEKSLTTDNAVMIATSGYLTYLSGEVIELKAQGNLKYI